MLNDKDIASVVGKLAHRVDRWYCASLPGPRGMSGQELADMVNKVVAGTDATPAMEENSREVRRIESREPASQGRRSEEHTSELQSLMRISYAVFCLKKKHRKKEKCNKQVYRTRTHNITQ